MTTVQIPQPMTEITFTFDWYEELLQRLLQEGYSFGSFSETVSPNTVLLRHDVDWSPRKAVQLAKIEADLGITSTYFFLVSSPFYNVMNAQERAQMAQISELGHEIGLHFSTHQHFDREPNGEDGHPPPDDELMVAINQERTVLKLQQINQSPLFRSIIPQSGRFEDPSPNSLVRMKHGFSKRLSTVLTQTSAGETSHRLPRRFHRRCRFSHIPSYGVCMMVTQPTDYGKSEIIIRSVSTSISSKLTEHGTVTMGLDECR